MTANATASASRRKPRPSRPKASRLSSELADARRQLREARRAMTRDGIDPAWREIANDLAEALGPYTMFGEQIVRENRVVVITRVPPPTLMKARRALAHLGQQVAVESYREV